MMENDPSDIVNFWLSGCRSQKGLRVAAMLPSMGMIPSLRVMINASAKTGGSVGIMVGKGAWL